MADIQTWSGLTRLGEAVYSLRRRLCTFRDERGRELFDVPDAPLPDPGTLAQPRFLAPFDNAILSHADRGRIVAESDRAVVNRDRLMRTFLVDGFVAGTWQLREGVLSLSTTRSLTDDELRELIEEADRFARFATRPGSGSEVRVDVS